MLRHEQQLKRKKNTVFSQASGEENTLDPLDKYRTKSSDNRDSQVIALNSKQLQWDEYFACSSHELMNFWMISAASRKCPQFRILPVRQEIPFCVSWDNVPVHVQSRQPGKWCNKGIRCSKCCQQCFCTVRLWRCDILGSLPHYSQLT